MQINMPESGTFLFVSDHLHVIENVQDHFLSIFPFHPNAPADRSQWRDGIPQGWLARDHPAWFQSTQRLKQLVRTTKGRVIPGHDKETFLALQSEGSTFT